ncbi:hypothetical protein lerEdw1_010194 [Lerista edwardsae]|nr:hypothetical protein lerEdw1_010194 [Lerista edwardsae]
MKHDCTGLDKALHANLSEGSSCLNITIKVGSMPWLTGEGGEMKSVALFLILLSVSPAETIHSTQGKEKGIEAKVMKSVVLFLIVLSVSPGILSDVQLVQSGSGMLKPGETLSLTCAATFVGDAIELFDIYTWSWIPGKGLEWMGLLFADTSPVYAPSLQS